MDNLTDEFLKAVEYYGFTVTQNNGQRIFRHSSYDELHVDLNNEIFIGKIPQNCFEDTLLPLTMRVGTLIQLKTMFCVEGTNRGYAFALYKTSDDRDRALLLLDNIVVAPGRTLGVKLCENRRRITVRNWPIESSKDNILVYLYQNTQNVRLVRLKSSWNGYIALVEYTDHAYAEKSRKYLRDFRFITGDRVHALQVASVSPYLSKADYCSYNEVASYDAESGATFWYNL